jgi:hypothetical protein
MFYDVLAKGQLRQDLKNIFKIFVFVEVIILAA